MLATSTEIATYSTATEIASKFAVVQAKDGRFSTRMVSNRELQLAQSFASEYRIVGTQAEVTRQIGNSVPPAVAKAITQAILSV